MTTPISPNGHSQRDLNDMVFLKPAIVCDLDGTIRHNPAGGYINGPDDIALYDGVIEALWRYRKKGYLILGATNQGGVAHGHKTPEAFQREMDRTQALAEQQHEDGWPFHTVQACFMMESGDDEMYGHRSLLRKTKYGMLAVLEHEARTLKGRQFIVDWDSSYMIGDREEDMACAQAAGVHFIHAEDWRQQIEEEIL